MVEGLEEKWSSRKVSLPCCCTPPYHCPMGIVEDMYNKYATNYPNHLHHSSQFLLGAHFRLAHTHGADAAIFLIVLKTFFNSFTTLDHHFHVALILAK